MVKKELNPFDEEQRAVLREALKAEATLTEKDRVLAQLA